MSNPMSFAVRVLVRLFGAKVGADLEKIMVEKLSTRSTRKFGRLFKT